MQIAARRAAAPVFALAMFSAAALIFVLQPLFGRLVTPLLGGSPQVWNVSMAFFQAALLAGYLYAHLLARLRDLRVQAAIHAAVLIGAWLLLPVRVTDAFGPPNSDHPALWLTGVLALSVGAPFAAISATAPLLQSWYARSGRADANDPYYLYAASNAGSFIGLLAYPIIVEPLLGTHAQSFDWSIGYLVAAALIIVSAAIVLSAQDVTAPTATHTRSDAPTWRQRVFWMGAAATPSALILGVTLHISTDVASAPMLWVVPLALYLVTFVIAFSPRSERLAQPAEIIFPFALMFLVGCYFSRSSWAVALSGNLIGFFVSAMLCHLALARSRPPADRLTEFYFFVSLGGVLGGAFAAFVAPVVFNDVYEYPLALAAAALFLPRGKIWMPRLADASIVAAVFMALLGGVLSFMPARDAVLAAGAFGAAAAVIAAGWGDPDRIAPFRWGALISAAIFAAAIVYAMINKDAVLPREGATSVFHFAPGWDWGLGVASFAALLFVTHATVQPRRTPTLLADIALGVAVPAILLVLALTVIRDRLTADVITTLSLFFIMFALFFNRMRPYVVAGLVLTAFVIIFVDYTSGARTITQHRSFFGVLRTRVIGGDSPNMPELRILMHGTTIHGAQIHDPRMSRLPLTYYNPNTSLGESILAGLNAGEHSRIALIGLGAGSTACLTRPTDELTIFEIDPAVVHLSARPGGDFSYVPECQPNAQLRLGDARLQIAHEPDGKFDVIVVDAFSSDAIPAHLLTREAITLYLRKTSDRGIVILHLSNRNLALVSEAARVAHALDAPALFRVSERVNDPNAPFYGGLAASTMIVAKNPQIIGQILPLLPSHAWRAIAPPPGRAWSDDYINLPRALWENFTGVEACRVYTDLPHCENARTEVK